MIRNGGIGLALVSQHDPL